MKVLYISHAREKSGWGAAARGYINALLSVGVDVVCRTVDFNPQYKEQWLEDLISKPIDGVTHCIQHVLPNLMEYDGRFKNIGLFVSETRNIQHTGWLNKLQLMDQVWVPSLAQKHEDNYKIVPHAFDLSIYNREYKQIQLEFGDRFIFYFIGEHIRRKNIVGLLKTYYNTFNANDNVALLIKTHRSGSPAEEVVQTIFDSDKTIREQLKLYSNSAYYPPIAVIGEYLSDEEIYGLHQRCDCFVTASFGEGWDIEAFDACGFGNKVIAGNYDAHSQYCDGLYSYMGHPEFVFGADTFVKGLHTGREIWYRPDELDMSWCMRNAYESTKKQEHFTKNFSYEKVGKIMLENLL